MPKDIDVSLKRIDAQFLIFQKHFCLQFLDFLWYFWDSLDIFLTFSLLYRSPKNGTSGKSTNCPVGLADTLVSFYLTPPSTGDFWPKGTLIFSQKQPSSEILGSTDRTGCGKLLRICGYAQCFLHEKFSLTIRVAEEFTLRFVKFIL